MTPEHGDGGGGARAEVVGGVRGRSGGAGLGDGVGGGRGCRMTACLRLMLFLMMCT